MSEQARVSTFWPRMRVAGIFIKHHAIEGRSTRWFAGILLLCLTGCFAPPEPPPFFPQPSLRAYFRPVTRKVQRVVVMPFSGIPRSGPYCEQIRESLIHELTACGRYEVVDLPPGELDACRAQIMLHGKMSEHELVRLAHRFEADAVLYGQAQVRREYSPQAMEVHLHLIDAREATLVSSVTGSWDLGMQNDLQRLCEFPGKSISRFRGKGPSGRQSRDVLPIRRFRIDGKPGWKADLLGRSRMFKIPFG